MGDFNNASILNVVGKHSAWSQCLEKCSINYYDHICFILGDLLQEVVWQYFSKKGTPKCYMGISIRAIIFCNIATAYWVEYWQCSCLLYTSDAADD